MWRSRSSDARLVGVSADINNFAENLVISLNLKLHVFLILQLHLSSVHPRHLQVNMEIHKKILIEALIVMAKKMEMNYISIKKEEELNCGMFGQ